MSKRINKDNYEAFFLDHAEGNLSDSDLLLLQEFLIAHPELQAELDDFESISLSMESSEEEFDGKMGLKREETTGLLMKDYLMIAELEKVNSSNEKDALSSLYQDETSLLKELNQYQKTILTPEDIPFPAKSDLYEEKKVRLLWLPYAAAAAVLFLVFFNLN